MLKIKKITVEGLEYGCFTDVQNPRFCITLESDRNGATAKSHRICISKNGEVVRDTGTVESSETLYLCCPGADLAPYSEYTAQITVCDDAGESACGEVSFETAKLDEDWSGRWIYDKRVKLEKNVIAPVRFAKNFDAKKPSKARLYITAVGNYFCTINGEKVGDQFLSPGWTTYKAQQQYQCYDVTELIGESNTIEAVVSGGWAVGRMFAMIGKPSGGAVAKNTMLLAELHLSYENGHTDIIATDKTWLSAPDGAYTAASIYDGVCFDARCDTAVLNYKKVSVTTPKMVGRLLATYGEPVRKTVELSPVSSHESKKGGMIYDFGQNIAGVVHLKVKGAAGGEKIVVRHTELLREGEIFTVNLRTAKATLEYICKSGDQDFYPELTFMGFQYIRVQGIDSSKIEVSAIAFTSANRSVGSFECSNSELNKLQSNTRWSGMDNFVDIPTDCPQRDERLGWTGDISVFASTACFNFDMSRFFEKWLLDLRAEQDKKNGALPFVIPAGKYGIFKTHSAAWGDCCVLVPWAQYLSGGDKTLLERQYESIKLYVDGCAKHCKDKKKPFIKSSPRFWGDWCAPEGNAVTWFSKAPWVGTLYWANSAFILAKIAKILGKDDDAAKYNELGKNISDAYLKEFTDGNGVLKAPFQTGYVCPLYFNMYDGEIRETMAQELRDNVVNNGNKLSTGFVGTPYLLFALSDNGYSDTAYDVLLQEECPGWLYEIRCGATTTWERWNGLQPDGTIFLKGDESDKRSYDPEDQTIACMVSFNHYAYGAVGDWLYRRVAGIEAIEGGYRRFKIAPVVGGKLDWVKAIHESNYGTIVSEWKISDAVFTLNIEVPFNTVCEVTLPNGESSELGCGKYEFSCKM